MKSTAIPVTCGVALAAMSAAGLSHWWSVRDLVALANDATAKPHEFISGQETLPARLPFHDPEIAASTSQPSGENATPGQRGEPMPATEDQRRFYESLITRMESLQNQNRDLLDQLAETNRDLMKLEFRVDTHSSSFRPLPLTEDQPFTSLDTDIGVLPPRAAPVMLPDSE
jgi:hypothetical protein